MYSSPTLEVSSFADGIQHHALHSSRMRVGRFDPYKDKPEDRPDIVVAADVVSRLHFDLIFRNAYWEIICRPGTTNELRYKVKDEEKVLEPNKSYELKHGDIFYIGQDKGRAVTLTFKDGRTIKQDNLPKIPPIFLGKDEITLGRHPNNKVPLDHHHVDEFHAILKKDGKVYRIFSLNNNPIFVNNKQTQDEILEAGDEIRIGSFKFIYSGTKLIQEEERDELIISAHKLKKVDGGKLEDVYLAIPPRAFVALIGGSGAGKSTLLKALNGKEPADGTILYNGEDYYQSLSQFRKQIGYVPQEDILHKNLTVEDALYYSARLRLPNYYNKKMIDNCVKKVLASVELEGKRKSYIEKLSGGQRKRVSIALELLTQPKILFLDEPTSSLDPGHERKMMKLLRNLTDKEGCTVILVTHATKSINLCDYVCFLADGGQMIYFGPPREMLDYFKKRLHENIDLKDLASVYDKLENEDEVISQTQKEVENIPISQQEAKLFRMSDEYERYQNFLKKIYERQDELKNKQQKVQAKWPKYSNFADYSRQFRYLCARYIKLLRNDKSNLVLLSSQAVVIAVLLWSFIFFGNLIGGFNTDTVVQCQMTPRAAHVLGIPDTSTITNPLITMNCSQLEHKLETSPKGKVYAASKGGAHRALQQFIQPGGKFSPIVLFIMAFAAVMFGCVNSIREIVKEIDIYKRERDVGIGIFPYLCSKVAVLGVICFVQCVILVAVVSTVNPFPHGTFLPGVVEIYITLILASLVGLMIGLFVSARVKSNEGAMSLIPLLLLPQVILSGTIFPLTNGILQTMGFFIPLRWAMGALGSSVGLHVTDSKDHLISNTPTYQSTLYSLYNQTDSTQYLLHLWIGLAAMVIAYFLLAYGTLLWKKRLPRTKRTTEISPLPRLPLPHCCNGHESTSWGRKFCGICGGSFFSTRPVSH